LRRSHSEPEIVLDSTPSGGEEYRDWLSEPALKPEWNPDAARSRIDRIARRLAVLWSLFLIYTIFAQANGDGYTMPLPWVGWSLRLVPKFHLEPSEFIAVVTTTTVSVFGFLVIVANHLFKPK
jgi:hypothetical protein